MSRTLARGLGSLCAFLASNTGLPDVLLSFGFLRGQPPVSRGSPSALFPRCPLYEV